MNNTPIIGASLNIFYLFSVTAVSSAVSQDRNSVISAILTVCPIFLRVGKLDSRTMSSGERGIGGRGSRQAKKHTYIHQHEPNRQHKLSRTRRFRTSFINVSQHQILFDLKAQINALY